MVAAGGTNIAVFRAKMLSPGWHKMKERIVRREMEGGGRMVASY